MKFAPNQKHASKFAKAHNTVYLQGLGALPSWFQCCVKVIASQQLFSFCASVSVEQIALEHDLRERFLKSTQCVIGMQDQPSQAALQLRSTLDYS